MIKIISSTEPSFRAYRQHFTNEEFQQRVDESLAWAKKNIDNSKYFKTKKGINKKLEKNAKNSSKILDTYKQAFKKTDFEPTVDLSLEEKELVGRVTYLNTTPVEIRTEMPSNFVKFFKSLIKSGKAQMLEDKLNLELWDIIGKEKNTVALQNKRYKELTPKNQEAPNPLVIYYDSVYNELSEKSIQLTKLKNEMLLKLDKLKPHLTNKQFKLKLK